MRVFSESLASSASLFDSFSSSIAESEPSLEILSLRLELSEAEFSLTLSVSSLVDSLFGPRGVNSLGVSRFEFLLVLSFPLVSLPVDSFASFLFLDSLLSGMDLSTFSLLGRVCLP